MPKLSRRETEVAQLVALGLANREIAERLFVSERTAEFHVEQIRNKLGFHTRHQIAEWVTARSEMEPPPNRLPPQLTNFIGRAHDLERVADLLEKTRVVTLTGAAGAGKTRLAIEAASRTLLRYPDGAWFVDLQALKDPGLLETEVASALSVADVERELAASRRLIVLDNCEQLAEACRALIERLLVASSGLKVLATSRVVLHVPGEAVWNLGPLPPEEAIALFLDRAGRAAPELSLANVDPAPVRAICQDLDGIPLAIELAASRARVMSLADIRARLNSRFRVLVDSGAHTHRHRSLAAAVAWSYDLLSEEDREVFRKLGIFAGGFLLDSAESVIGPDVAGALDRLVERSMVVAERVPDRPTRYRLLVTMREYARELMTKDGKAASLRSAHAGHFRTLADLASAQLQGPRQATWMRRIEDELDEYRSAFEWALETDPETAVAIAVGLGWFWGMGGRLTEGRQLLAKALTTSPERSYTRAHVLIDSGWLARLQGEFESGIRFHAESVEILGELGDPLELGTALIWRAEAARDIGDIETARDGWEQAIELLAPLGVSLAMGYAYIELSELDLRECERDVERGREYANQGLALMTELGNVRAIALCRSLLSYAGWLEGDLDRATNELRQCLTGLTKVAARADLIKPLELAAAIELDRGNTESGIMVAAAAAALVQSMNFGRSTVWLVGVDLITSRLERARAEIGEAAYEVAWTLGEVLDADDAVELVLHHRVSAP